MQGVRKKHLRASNHATPAAVRGNMPDLLRLFASLIGDHVSLKRCEAFAVGYPNDLFELFVELSL